MRICDNCFNGSYNLRNGKELTLWCNYTGIEFQVEPEDTCDCHRYMPDLEEEKKFIFYDESYLGPGYLIVNIKDKKVNKLLKVYNASKNEFPLLGIRAHSVDTNENLHEEFSSIDFSFRDIEDDDENGLGLFDLFYRLTPTDREKRIYSVDVFKHGKNNLKLNSNASVVYLTLYRDNYSCSQQPCDYIDILIGDEHTCEDYDSIIKFWEGLSKICTEEISSDDVKRMVLTSQKNIYNK